MRKLTAKEKHVVEAFKKTIEEQYPGELVRLTLFGSKARGDASKESDIDIQVVFDLRTGSSVIGFASRATNSNWNTEWFCRFRSSVSNTSSTSKRSSHSSWRGWSGKGLWYES
ncbi:MAG TPA: nucleotidyltransferase domain-containing protein [Nitrospiria bacterium]|nr:nucleotidyltransferase domain-containing protein [Nitrospiria bacterium]